MNIGPNEHVVPARELPVWKPANPPVPRHEPVRREPVRQPEKVPSDVSRVTHGVSP